MTLLEAYDAARDFLSVSISTAWDTVAVAEGRVFQEPRGDYAYFELSGALIEFETPVTDSVTFTFTVLGLWSNPRLDMGLGREIFKMQQASGLHALLSVPEDGAQKIYALRVESVEPTDFVDDNQNDVLGVSLVWTCQASIDRGA